MHRIGYPHQPALAGARRSNSRTREGAVPTKNLIHVSGLDLLTDHADDPSAMSDFLKSIILSLVRRVIARSSIEADIVALHHRVAVLRRQIRHRPKLTRWDRLLFAVLYRVQPGVLQSINIVRPECPARKELSDFSQL